MPNEPLVNPVVDARIVYCHLRAPDRFGKYSCTLVVDKNDPMVKKINAELGRLVKENFAGKKPTDRMIPIKEAAESFGEDFKDCIVIRCTSTEPVDLFNPDKSRIEEDKAMRNGSNVRALVAFSAYTNQWGNGITCFINGVQYVSAGEPIGRTKPDAGGFFEPIEGAENAGPASPGDDPASFFTS